MRSRTTGRIADLVSRLKETSAETKAHAASIAAILAVTVVLFLPLMRGRTFSMVGAHMFAQYPWIGTIRNSPEIKGRGFPQTDHAEVFYPSSVFATNAIRSGQIPMWLPFSFSGVPIMELGASYAPFYPPKLLATTVFSPVRQHEVLLFSHLLLAGLGMYALLRCWGANGLGAVFGAIVWELNGQQAFFLTFEAPAIAAAWLPIMMLGATLAIKRQSIGWAVITGAAMGMSLLGNVFLSYVSSWVLICWYFFLTLFAAHKLFINRQRRAAVFCLFLPLISAAVAAVLGAASWLSLFGSLSNVHRRALTLATQIGEANTLLVFLRGIIVPVSGSDIESKFPDFAFCAFVGAPALFLAVPAIFRRTAPVVLAFLLALASTGLILGIRPIVMFFRLVLPYFGAMHLRVAYSLFCFAMATLAALGITEISKRIRGFAQRPRLLLGLSLLLLAFESVQLIVSAWAITPTQPISAEWLFPETPLITNLKDRQGAFHVLPVSFRHPSNNWTPPVLAGKVNVVFGLRSGSGYESLLPLSTVNLWRAVERGGVIRRDLPPAYRPYFYHDRLPVGLLEKLSIGFIATPPNTEPRDVDGSDVVANGRLQLVYQGPDGWIYKLTHALPRAFVVPTVLTVPDSEASLRTLVDKSFDSRRAAIVVGDNRTANTGLPAFDSAAVESGATSTIVRDQLNEVEVEVNAPREGMLVLNDSWDAGWVARVDGQKQPLLKVNYNFRGVVVPAGNHRVVFLYRPPLVLIGLGISGLALFLLFVFCGTEALRRSRRSGRETAPPAGVHSRRG
ncbi:MAG: YfhO family protein [Acidobacteriota bacterium]|nr:YfhO family protein [Acidobacteriota bacterium]